MDVESKETIEAAIAKLQVAEDEWLNRLAAALPVVITCFEKTAIAILDHAAQKFQGIIDSLDGWSLNKPEK